MDPQTQLLIQQLMQKYPGMTAQQAQATLASIQKSSGAAGFDPANASSLPGMPGPQPQSQPQPFHQGPPAASAPVTAPLAPPPGMTPPGHDNTPRTPPPASGPDVAAQVSTPGTTAAPNQGPPPPNSGDAGGQGAPPAPNGTAYNVPQGASELSSFGLGDNEFGDAWGSKVYQNGNPGLYNPNVRNSPWGQFLLEHYGTQMQANTSEGLLNGQVADQPSSPAFARDQLAQQAAGGGAAAGGNQVGSLLQSAYNLADAGGGKVFDNLSQNTALHGLADDNQGQANLVREGLNGVGGGWGRNYINSVLASQSAQSANNPQQFGPGQWALAALNQLGIK